MRRIGARENKKVPPTLYLRHLYSCSLVGHNHAAGCARDMQVHQSLGHHPSFAAILLLRHISSLAVVPPQGTVGGCNWSKFSSASQMIVMFHNHVIVSLAS